MDFSDNSERHSLNLFLPRNFIADYFLGNHHHLSGGPPCPDTAETCCCFRRKKDSDVLDCGSPCGIAPYSLLPHHTTSWGTVESTHRHRGGNSESFRRKTELTRLFGHKRNLKVMHNCFITRRFCELIEHPWYSQQDSLISWSHFKNKQKNSREVRSLKHSGWD